MMQYNAPFQRVSQHPRRWQQENSMYAEQRLECADNATAIKSPTIPVGEIGVQAQTLSMQIDWLNSAIAMVVNRLDPILGIPRDSDSSPETALHWATDMGRYLAVQNERLEAAIEQLHTLIARIEL